MELSAVPEALVTVRAARDKMKGKSEGKRRTCSLHFWKGQGKVAKTPTQPNICRKRLGCEKKPSRHVTRAVNVVIGLAILDALERETPMSGLGQMNKMLPDREDSRTIMMVERIEQFGVFPPSSSLREHSVCTTSVSNLPYFPVDAHIPQCLLLSPTPFLLHSQLILKKCVVL